MSAAELALLVFTVCNSVRLLAFAPQIVTIWRDRHGATAVSCTSWALFGVSHLATVAYALLDKGDWNMAAIFGANAFCCAVIITLTLWKRAQHRAAQDATGPAARKRSSAPGCDPCSALAVRR